MTRKFYETEDRGDREESAIIRTVNNFKLIPVERRKEILILLESEFNTDD